MLGTPPPTMAAPLSVATLTLVLLTVAMSASGQADTNTTGGVGGIPLNKCIEYIILEACKENDIASHPHKTKRR